MNDGEESSLAIFGILGLCNGPAGDHFSKKYFVGEKKIVTKLGSKMTLKWPKMTQ